MKLPALPSPLPSYATDQAMRIVIAALMCFTLIACNGTQYKQAKRMTDFQVTQSDFDSIAVATFKLIDAKRDINIIVAPASLNSRARQALRNVHPIVTASPGAANTLPVRYFLVREFRVEGGEAYLEGQLGPVTGLLTAANMPDCGKVYSVGFYIEGGDWVSHAYKMTTCAESRHWVPVDGTSQQHEEEQQGDSGS
jgi:hypothetical protein